mmetsp:Transcript_155926/g.298985  ORF Transcript_155926/g.298985 Transcript_155926/m.298985 type:complete len:240 (+) Transcript_155926:32-751(+)
MYKTKEEEHREYQRISFIADSQSAVRIALMALSSSASSPSTSVTSRCPNNFHWRCAERTSLQDPDESSGTADQDPSCRPTAASAIRGATHSQSGGSPATRSASRPRPCDLAVSKQTNARASSTRSREQTAARIPRPLRKREASRSSDAMRTNNPLSSLSNLFRCKGVFKCRSTSLVHRLQLRPQRPHSKSRRRTLMNSSPGSDSSMTLRTMSSGSAGRHGAEGSLSLHLLGIPKVNSTQ